MRLLSHIARLPALISGVFAIYSTVGIGPALSAVMEDATIDTLRRAAPRIAERLTSPADQKDDREN